MKHRSPADPPAFAERSTGGDDPALLERLRRDDRDAMTELYDRYGRLAFGLAYRIVGEPAEAEDVVQESFLSVWRQAKRLDPERGSLRSLLLTIVHRRSVDMLRRRSGRPALGLENVALPASSASDPVDQASLAEDRERVRRAMEELPEEQRRAVELTYFGSLTIAEMAEQQGIPLGTAKSRLRLAMERLRKALEPR